MLKVMVKPYYVISIHMSASQSVCDWLVSEHYPRLVWQSVEDGEGYVRASALTTITHMTCDPRLWSGLTVQVTTVIYLLFY